jgi:hypothetical protein
MQRLASIAHGHRRLVSLIIGLSTLSVAAVAVAAIVSGNSTTGASNHVTYTQLTLSVPTVSAGDVMIASVAIKGGAAAVMVTVPSGWTQIARADNDTNTSLISYWKVASSADASGGSYTWTIQDQTRAEGGITGYSGVDTSSPVDVASTNTGRSKIATTTAVTTSTGNEEVIALFATDVGTTSGSGYFSAPTTTSMTQKYNASNAALGPSVAAFDMLRTSSGSTGSISSGTGDNKTRDWAAQEIALKVSELSCSGGTVSTSSGRTIHTFLTSGTFDCTGGASGAAEVLVVGGGGGGGMAGAPTGGGGGGGYQYDGSHLIGAQSYAVSVGTGGAVAVDQDHRGSNGGNSVFDTITAIGGGGGGSRNGETPGADGGSGGGKGGGGAGTGGTGTQGHNGGTSGSFAGGGGGGCGAAGTDGANGVGGNGGNGCVNTISDTTVTYAGGGAGAGGTTNGSPGTGGGGDGIMNGTDGLGGGGGAAGGSGGSGVVIISYPTP